MKTNKEQTGRTTRMLEEAIRLAREGKTVYVIFESVEMARLMRCKKLPEMAADEPAFVRIKFESPMSADLNWETLRLRGVYFDCVVLVDHSVIERRFSRMLEMLQRFDSPQSKPNPVSVEGFFQTREARWLCANVGWCRFLMGLSAKFRKSAN